MDEEDGEMYMYLTSINNQKCKKEKIDAISFGKNVNISLN
jgi:hypothetical protein